MPATWAARASALSVVVLLVIVGCVGPLQSADVTDDAATDRALSAEERHISARLSNVSCLSEWGVGSATVVESANVENRTDGGVHVRVTHPYWYEQVHQPADPNVSGAVSHADAAAEATYRVTGEETTRLQGTTVAPC